MSALLADDEAEFEAFTAKAEARKFTEAAERWEAVMVTAATETRDRAETEPWKQGLGDQISTWVAESHRIRGQAEAALAEPNPSAPQQDQGIMDWYASIHGAAYGGALGPVFFEMYGDNASLPMQRSGPDGWYLVLELCDAVAVIDRCYNAT